MVVLNARFILCSLPSPQPAPLLRRRSCRSSMCGGFEAPAPNRWLPDRASTPLIDLSQPLAESACETTPYRALEARNVKRKASRVLGRKTFSKNGSPLWKAMLPGLGVN